MSWDPSLIPPSQDEPMDYYPAKPVILDHDVTIEVDVFGYGFYLARLIDVNLAMIHNLIKSF